jgi:hypothetical protein
MLNKEDGNLELEVTMLQGNRSRKRRVGIKRADFQIRGRGCSVESPARTNLQFETRRKCTGFSQTCTAWYGLNRDKKIFFIFQFRHLRTLCAKVWSSHSELGTKKSKIRADNPRNNPAQPALTRVNPP